MNNEKDNTAGVAAQVNSTPWNGVKKDALSMVRITLDAWVRRLLVDPLDKGEITFSADGICSSSNRYVCDRGIPDMRVLVRGDSELWAKGQAEFEKWIPEWLGRQPEAISREIGADRAIYSRHPLPGRILDVGGQLGQVRLFVPGQDYVSLDPFIEAPFVFDKYPAIVEQYQLDQPLNFIAGVAEYLPFRNEAFDSVNMRSCLDHFSDTSAALFEARRVLRVGGRLVVGVSVIRELSPYRKLASKLLGRKDKDHHMWHPKDKGELIGLVEKHGFVCDHWSFQPEFGEAVVYASFYKKRDFQPFISPEQNFAQRRQQTSASKGMSRDKPEAR